MFYNTKNQNFPASNLFLNILLIIPYFLGEPFKTTHESSLRHWTKSYLREDYYVKWSKHYFIRIILTSMILVLMVFFWFTPIGLLSLVLIAGVIGIVCLHVDFLLMVFRIIYIKIDENERKLNAEEEGNELLPAPLDYYKDSSLDVLFRKRDEDIKKFNEESAERKKGILY